MSDVEVTNNQAEQNAIRAVAAIFYNTSTISRVLIARARMAPEARQPR